MCVGRSGIHGEKPVWVRRQEYVGDVLLAADGAFRISEGHINPGLSNLFPVLNQIACCFESYQIHQLAFVYKTTCSDSILGTLPSVGTVNMVIRYDALTAPFTSKLQMNNYFRCCSFKPTQSFAVRYDPASFSTHQKGGYHSHTSVPQWYVRNGPVPAGADARLYDAGILSIATEGAVGAVANQKVGEIWVVYAIGLMTPKMGDHNGDQIPTVQWIWQPVPTATPASPEAADPPPGYFSYNGARAETLTATDFAGAMIATPGMGSLTSAPQGRNTAASTPRVQVGEHWVWSGVTGAGRLHFPATAGYTYYMVTIKRVYNGVPVPAPGPFTLADAGSNVIGASVYFMPSLNAVMAPLANTAQDPMYTGGIFFVRVGPSAREAGYGPSNSISWIHITGGGPASDVTLITEQNLIVTQVNPYLYDIGPVSLATPKVDPIRDYGCLVPPVIGREIERQRALSDLSAADDAEFGTELAGVLRRMMAEMKTKRVITSAPSVPPKRARADGKSAVASGDAHDPIDVESILDGDPDDDDIPLHFGIKPPGGASKVPPRLAAVRSAPPPRGDAAAPSDVRTASPAVLRSPPAPSSRAPKAV